MPNDTLKSFVYVIAVLLLIIFMAYYTTRFIGNRSRGFSKGRHIHIKESLAVARDKSVMLLEIGDMYYLVGVTNQNMQLLGTINKEELPAPDAEEVDAPNGFKGAVSRLVQWIKGLANAPAGLHKAQEQYRRQESEGRQSDTGSVLQYAEIIEDEGNVYLLHKRKKGSSPAEKPGKGKRAGEKAAEREVKKESPRSDEKGRFAKILHDTEDTFPAAGFGYDESNGMIVQLSHMESPPKQANDAPKKRGRKNGKAADEDEINRMLHSIEQRTQQLKKKQTEEDTDE